MFFLQKQGSMAIRNIVSRSPELNAGILELGAESVLQRSLNIQKCHDEAKSALRDLGCELKLKELWTGEGKGIKH